MTAEEDAGNVDGMKCPNDIHLGMTIRISDGRMATLCDKDWCYATIMVDGQFRRINLPIFFENMGWDEKANTYYLVKTRMAKRPA